MAEYEYEEVEVEEEESDVESVDEPVKKRRTKKWKASNPSKFRLL